MLQAILLDVFLSQKGAAFCPQSIKEAMADGGVAKKLESQTWLHSVDARPALTNVEINSIRALLRHLRSSGNYNGMDIVVDLLFTMVYK